MVIRLLLIAVFVVITLTNCTKVPTSAFGKNWERYASQFYQDGRIVDTGNQSVSHSEGQGYGMLFAVEADDKDRFRAMWQWSKKNLQRDDALFSWRYRPCDSSDRSCIDDPNNASDGDILIAWALVRAADKWQSKQYREDAILILNAIKQKLIKERFNMIVLLPGEYGFDTTSNTEINLSYWVFPAFEAFFELTSDPIWQQLNSSGKTLVNQSKFSQWQLPPDWVRVTNQGVSLENTQTQEYGFNAVRVPLQLAWVKDSQNTTSLIAPFIRFWEQDYVPATVQLPSGQASEYQMTKGMSYSATVVINLYNNSPNEIVPLPLGEDYYSSSLILLSQLAAIDNQK